MMPEHTIIRTGMSQNSVGAPRLFATRCSFTNLVVPVGLPRIQMREDDMLHPKSEVMRGVFSRPCAAKVRRQVGRATESAPKDTECFE
ncbi:hypothetical protein PILCRDRAFT_276697 [Piloderma croceum F 1598]|uniref:Uncharacterized protein n=1 Tax=Piloderma croceum (strain F 1598) TaxID=765440 RepID=A0A0C3G6I3_PILCF|nr:hypothetical protein PILCRDRAFT_276697 [Piloderma croceum F 1598]